MANEEQLSILKQGVEVWNKWNQERLEEADAAEDNIIEVDLSGADLIGLDLIGANLTRVNLSGCWLIGAALHEANLRRTNLTRADLSDANLFKADLSGAALNGADLSEANLDEANLSRANLQDTNFSKVTVSDTIFGNLDLRQTIGLHNIRHWSPSTIGTNTFVRSKGTIPEVFLRGCGLSDWEEEVKLYNPSLSNDEITQIQYRIHELRATQALQISPLFLSYSHADTEFVDKIGDSLNQKGVRYWRDIHDMKSGRMEKQIDRAIRQNPTVLLVLSKHSLSSDWVEHEVRTGREIEKELSRDVLCPVALDDSWKSSRWPKRIMEQVMEYNILDFSAWRDDSKFDSMFRRLIDGLELFYKG